MRVDLLKPYQVEPASQLAGVLQHRNAVDASDTGVGKTFMSLAAAEALGRRVLAIVPKVSTTSWYRAASLFGLPGFTVISYDSLRTGRTPRAQWENTPPAGFRLDLVAKCQCCQQEVDLDAPAACYTHPLGIHCIELKKKPWDYGRFIWNIHPSTLLVFDEIHRCAAMDSLNGKMLITATAQQYRILGLSATLADSPLDMRAIGYMLGLHQLNGDQGFYPWARRHGCGQIEGVPGFHFKVGKERQGQVMQKIHTTIFPSRGVRLRKADISDFPACSFSSDLIDLPEGEAEIEALYEEIRLALGRQDAREKLDKAPDLAITKMIRARQRIEILKIPAVIELTEDYLAKGVSIAIFVNFLETLVELQRRFRKQCVILDGTQTDRERQFSLDAFADDRARVMIANSAAGGESANMQDVRGEFPRGGLVMPPLSARLLRQIMGRLPRIGAKSPSFYRLLLAAGTIEEKIKRNLDKSGGNMDYLNDGDLSPFENQN